MHQRGQLLILTLLVNLLLAGRAAPLGQTTVIPFTLNSQNNIVVKTILNDTDVLQLMLHTATADVRLTEEAVQKLKSLKFAGATKVGSWGGAADSRFSKENRLRIGAMQRKDLTVWEDKNSGQGTDGKFGLDFFENRIVEIDFDHHRLVVHQRLPAKAKTYTRLKMENQHGDLFVSGSCLIEGNAYTTKFLLHSGYAGGILLDDAFATSAGVDGKIKITDESALQDSFGHTIKVKKGLLPAFTLGDVTLANIPTGFFSGSLGAQKISVIGGAVLTRFNLIFDVARNDLYLALRTP